MSREEKLTEFVAWAQHHITGDEKGQAQIFLDRLFQAFGHPGVLDISQGSQPQSATATSGPTSSPRASAISLCGLESDSGWTGVGRPPGQMVLQWHGDGGVVILVADRGLDRRIRGRGS